MNPYTAIQPQLADHERRNGRPTFTRKHAAERLRTIMALRDLGWSVDVALTLTDSELAAHFRLRFAERHGLASPNYPASPSSHGRAYPHRDI